MRVLNVIGWLAPRYGGSVNVVIESTERLRALRVDVEIVATDADGPGTLDVATGRPIPWGAAIATLHRRSRPRAFLTSWGMLVDLWRRVPTFDVIHIHTLYRFHTIAAAVVARVHGVPYVIQPHGSLDAWHRSHRRRWKDLYHFLVEDRLIRGAATIVCTSERERQQVDSLGLGVPITVIPVGIDAEALRTASDRAGFETTHGLAASAVVVTFFGRISPKKGVDLLVHAFVETAKGFPAAHLLIVGPDDEGIGARLMPVIVAAGLEARVSFIGNVTGSEKRAVLQRADVFVLPSADESFGIAAAEAMAVGCPVVVSPYVAIAGDIEQAGAGVISEREPRAIADAISVVLGDPDAAGAMGDAGRRVVDSTFAWPPVLTKLQTMYGTLALYRARETIRDAPPEAHPGFAAKSIGTLVCPMDRAPLADQGASLVCLSCRREYYTVDGIPVVVADLSLVDQDEIDHHEQHSGYLGDAHKTAQAAHFDRAIVEEFEISRPHATPRLYQFLLGEKYRRGIGRLGTQLRGVSALTVCGGSGMDAEFLARSGASVVATDVSVGAARRAKERARRYSLAITPVVADVERLPFADRSFDVVFVHDGLHHLERPEAGLREMARVARRWVSVTEPARAAATSVAIRAGLALECEEAGNRVARLDPNDVVAVLREEGFRPLVAERYAMYYRHQPGRVSRALSNPLVFPIVRASWKLANGLLGRFGNKLIVLAERNKDVSNGD
jgi:glycosyltransferase involved in cell wall biosynthesis/SAM-dependent methyltransferase/uncharacterized protein YbaR (Trm112 family)